MNKNTNVLFGIFTLYLIFLSHSSFATPAAEWSPQKLQLQQTQGALSSHDISVTLVEDTDSFVVDLGPQLSKWITASPASFEQASAGEKINITLIINLPPDAPVKNLNGTIKLRSRKVEKPHQVIAKPLPFSLKIDKKSHADKPNHPGKAGKETLLGIDKDQDGVRDDIQLYIAETYPDEESVRLALTEIAKQYQIILIQTDVPDTALYNAIKMDRHTECLWSIKGTVAGDMTSELHAEIFNTKTRSIEYIKFSDNLAGEIIMSKPLNRWKQSCAFDLDLVGGIQ